MNGIEQPEPLVTAGQLLSPAIHVGSDPSLAPDGAGAYALLVQLGRAARFTLRGKEVSLASGWYLYAGSAWGPGGIRARLRRHFRQDKKIHWHVDHLTAVADQLSALAMPGGRECGIVARLSDANGFQTILDGFGSSDCSTCRSHLLFWTANPLNPIPD